MSRHREAAPRPRGLVLVVTLTLVVTATIAMGGRATYALFSDSATVKAGTSANTAFTAGSVAKPVVSSVTQSGATKVDVSWAPSKVGAHGASASGYEVFRFADPSGGTGTSVCTTTSATSCVDTSAQVGRFHYEVRARFEAAWVKDSDRVAISVVAALPAPTNVRCVDNGNNSYIAWDAPTGPSLTGYRVYYDSNGNGPSGNVDVPSTQRTYRPPTAFINNQKYTVTIAALSGTWVSETSESADIRIRSVVLAFTYTC